MHAFELAGSALVWRLVLLIELAHRVGIKSHDQTKNQQRALRCEPETEGPTEEAEVEVAGKIGQAEIDQGPEQQPGRQAFDAQPILLQADCSEASILTAVMNSNMACNVPQISLVAPFLEAM